MRKGIRFYNGEYAHEEGFSVTAPANRGEIITPQDLVEMITKEEVLGYIAIVGQAGSGKTTTMKRIARSVMVASDISENSDPWYEMFTNLFRNQKRRYKMLYFLSVKDIPNVPSVGVGELLFKKSLTGGVNNKVLKYGYSWITQNQSKVIIFLDGLDQATWSFEDTWRGIGPWDRASTSTIMQNLLSHRILPDVQLIVSSREHAVATLPNELRPTNIVALAGLDPRDVEKLFVSIVGIGGIEAWNELTRTSPILVRISSVPLFLIFNTIVWIHCKRKELTPPDSITGVMLAILSIIPRSSHLLVLNRATEMMQNMKGLAFNATKAKKLTFCNDDLERYGLDASDTSHLIIGVPKETLLSQHLMTGEDYIFFFSHQILQEMFSALFLADMKGSELKQFVSDEDGLHSNHWSVVRRMLCGILFNPDVNKYISSGFLRVGQLELKEKREILRSSLQQQMNRTLTEYQRLEFYGALYEANDANLIESSVHKIEFVDVEFPFDGMHTLSSIMRRCHYLAILRLVKCGLDREMLEILGSNTAGLNLQVDVLDISGNNMDRDAILAFNVALGNFNVGELIMGNCNLTASTLEDLTIKNTKVWNLMSFDNMDFELFYAIGKAATKGRLEEVSMTPWKHWVAKGDQVKKLSKLQVLGEVDILEIKLTGNINEILAIEKRCRIKEVRAHLSGNIMGTFEAISVASRWKISGKVKVLVMEVAGDISIAISAKTSTIERFHAESATFRLLGMISCNQEMISRLAKENIFGQVDILETQLTGEITKTAGEISLIEKRCQIKEIKARLSGRIIASSEAIYTTARWKISGEVDILETELTGDMTKITSKISSMKNHCQIKEIRARLSGNIIANREVISIASGWKISGEVDILEVELTGNITETISEISSIEKRCRIKDARTHLSGNIVGTWEAISVVARWKISGQVEVLRMELTGDPKSAISAKTSVKERFHARSVIFRLSGMITTNQETISRLAKENITGQVDILKVELTGNITETISEISSIEKRCRIKDARAHLSGNIVGTWEAISVVARWEISGQVKVLRMELTGDPKSAISAKTSVKQRFHARSVIFQLSGMITSNQETISRLAKENITGQVDVLEIELTGNITETISEISSIEKRCRIKDARAHLSGNIVATWEAISVVAQWKISGQVEELQMELTGDPRNAISAKSSIKERFKAKNVIFRLSGIITSNQETISRMAKEIISGQVDVLETDLTGDITETTEEISLIERRCQIKEIQARLSGNIKATIEALGIAAGWKISGKVESLDTELTGGVGERLAKISVIVTRFRKKNNVASSNLASRLLALQELMKRNESI